MNIPPSLREPRPGRRDRPLEIYAMQAGPAGLEVPVHWHDHAEILLMQAGELALTVEGEPRTGRPGDVFYLNPRALHGMRSPGPECRYLAFVFPLPWLGFAQADEAEDYLRPLAEGSARVATQLPPDSAAAAGVLLNQAAAWAKSEAPGGWLGVKGCLLQLFARLYADGQIKSRPAETALADTLRAIAKHLEEHCAERITLAEMGARFHMSAKYFSVFFKRYFAQGFAAYLTALRLERAKQLLAETDAVLDVIAQAAGLSSANYLIRVFHAATGLTPGQWRRQSRAAPR